MLMEDVAQQGSSLLMGMSADQSTPAPPPLPSNTAPPCFPSTPAAVAAPPAAAAGACGWRLHHGGGCGCRGHL